MAIASTKISPFLWFNENAAEAADFYLSVFPNSKKIGGLTGPDGKVITVSFQLEGVPFTALNGNKEFTFNHSVSFFISCKDQTEIDYYWDKFLSTGGAEVACGWITDKVRSVMAGRSRKHHGTHQASKAFQAMMTMQKLVIADLEAAATE